MAFVSNTVINTPRICSGTPKQAKKMREKKQPTQLQQVKETPKVVTPVKKRAHKISVDTANVASHTESTSLPLSLSLCDCLMHFLSLFSRASATDLFLRKGVCNDPVQPPIRKKSALFLSFLRRLTVSCLGFPPNLSPDTYDTYRRLLPALLAGATTPL